MMMFSADRVLEKAGGYNGLKDALEKAGQPVPSYNAVTLWRFRGLIPGWWIGAILYALAAEQAVHPIELLVDTSPLTDDTTDEESPL